MLVESQDLGERGRRRVCVHVWIGPRDVRRCDTSIDQPVVSVLQTRDIDGEDFVDVIRKSDVFYFDAEILVIMLRIVKQINNVPKWL